MTLTVRKPVISICEAHLIKLQFLKFCICPRDTGQQDSCCVFLMGWTRRFLDTEKHPQRECTVEVPATCIYKIPFPPPVHSMKQGVGRQYSWWSGCYTNRRIWVWFLRIHIKKSTTIKHSETLTCPWDKWWSWGTIPEVDPWLPYHAHGPVRTTCVYTRTQTHMRTHMKKSDVFFLPVSHFINTNCSIASLKLAPLPPLYIQGHPESEK